MQNIDIIENQTEEVEGLEVSSEVGRLAENWINSPVGLYVINKANDIADEAISKLILIEPTDAKEIQRLQNEIFIAKSIQLWLLQAVEEGITADQILEQR